MIEPMRGVTEQDVLASVNARLLHEASGLEQRAQHIEAEIAAAQAAVNTLRGNAVMVRTAAGKVADLAGFAPAAALSQELAEGLADGLAPLDPPAPELGRTSAAPMASTDTVAFTDAAVSADTLRPRSYLDTAPVLAEAVGPA